MKLRPALTLAAALGAAFAVYLIIHHGVAAVLAALSAAGWVTLGALSLGHLVPIFLRGAGWRVLLGSSAGAGWIGFAWVRFIREGVDNVLPLLSVSGPLAGARILRIWGQNRAGASAVVDLTMELASQILFAGIGLELLAVLKPSDPHLVWAAIGIGGIAVAAAGFVITQITGLFRLFDQPLTRWRRRLQATPLGIPERDTVDGLHDQIRGFYRDPRRLAAASSLHLLAWIASSLELWLALWLMGAPLGVPQALVIESLVFALRSATFFVPWSAGVQESGYVIVGVIFGMGPDVALAVSLLKRGRDLLLGVPAVLAWQVMEGRGVFTRAGGQTLLGLDAEGD